MLRMYVAQQCLGLSDDGTEDAIYDSQAIRGFVGIDLNCESAPDATTLLKFRHMLEANGITRQILLSPKKRHREGGASVFAAIICAVPPLYRALRGTRSPPTSSAKWSNWRDPHPLRTGLQGRAPCR